MSNKPIKQIIVKKTSDYPQQQTPNRNAGQQNVTPTPGMTKQQLLNISKGKGNRARVEPVAPRPAAVEAEIQRRLALPAGDIDQITDAEAEPATDIPDVDGDELADWQPSTPAEYDVAESLGHPMFDPPVSDEPTDGTPPTYPLTPKVNKQ